MDDSDETFMQKLDELHLYLQYCNCLTHQENYYELSVKEKAEFVEHSMKRLKEAEADGMPFKFRFKQIHTHTTMLGEMEQKNNGR